MLVYRFYGAVRIDGKIYLAKTQYRSSKGANEAYDYKITEVKLIVSGSSTSNARTNPTSISIAKVLKEVEKSYDNGKKLLEEREKIAEEETLSRLSPDSQQIFDTAKEKFGTTLDMLHTIGFEYKGGTISDNELRYILWRSHENLKDGRYADVFSQAKYLHINAVVLGVSIHAPTGVRLVGAHRLAAQVHVSIHAPTRGATVMVQKY